MTNVLSVLMLSLFSRMYSCAFWFRVAMSPNTSNVLNTRSLFTVDNIWIQLANLANPRGSRNPTTIAGWTLLRTRPQKDTPILESLPSAKRPVLLRRSKITNWILRQSCEFKVLGSLRLRDSIDEPRFLLFNGLQSSLGPFSCLVISPGVNKSNRFHVYLCCWLCCWIVFTNFCTI